MIAATPSPPIQSGPLCVFVPILVYSENRYRRQSWRVTAAITRRQRGHIALALYNHKSRLLQLAEGRVQVTLTQVASRRLDEDNLQGALKAIRDEIAAQLKMDDADSQLRWIYKQETTSDRRNFGVKIEIAAIN